MNQKYVALIDCNNFYASCEEVFNPRLKQKPLVVLSNNDGCVIARSQKAKALGIPMGAPAWEYRDLFEKHKVIQLSSNFALYGDMSKRVHTTIASFNLPFEVYSIDESFILLDDLSIAEELRKRVIQWTGIPTSIGIAKTKTLAKIASHVAKKGSRVHFFQSKKQILETLAQTDIREIWGIGRRKASKLYSYGIQTALQLHNADLDWIRKKFSVITEKTVRELRGQNCIDLEEIPNLQKSVLCSRSFGSPVCTHNSLSEAIATFTAKAAFKLRKNNLLANHLSIFTDQLFSETNLPMATADTPFLLSYAAKLLEEKFQLGLVHKKAGVLLSNLSFATHQQKDLFASQEAFKGMAIFDQVNKRFGKGTLRFAAEGICHNWKSKQAKRSPRYTTCWDEIPILKI